MIVVEKYENVAHKMLSEKRFVHSKNVSETAVKLAERYGADTEKARIAGILHDIMKDTKPDDQLKMMRNFGMIISEFEKSTDKLWHSISGAVYAENVLGIKDKDIINAIKYHTTARAGMSLLERVVFVSDFISAERNYKGVEKIRRFANESLEKAMIEGISFNINDLIFREMPVHPNTFSAYNELVSVLS